MVPIVVVVVVVLSRFLQQVLSFPASITAQMGTHSLFESASLSIHVP